MSSSVFAAGPSRWTHSSEADFKKGTFDSVVATNLGDLKLSRAVKVLLEQDPRVSTVYALAEGPDGTIYAGTGPKGIILKVTGEKVGTLATLDDENIFSLLVDRNGRLLAGTGGERGRILRVNPADGKSEEFFAAEGVQYVWQIRQTADGTIYAATGPNGQIHEIKPDGTRAILFDGDESNILSLISDGQDTLYAGTDPNGLVYRIDRKTKEVFVLYDAPESEISTLALDAKGNLYAGTGQASEADEGAGEAATEKTGRPEGGARSVPLPSTDPKEPNAPKLPEPVPPQPNPIPRTQYFIDDPMAFIGDDDHAAPAPPSPGPAPAPGNPVPPTTQQPRVGVISGGRPGMPGDIGGGVMPNGNAIYRIEPAGFVTEVFRQPGMVLSILERDGTLLVGTGSDGLVYEVNPAAGETIVLAKVEPKQVMSLLAAKDGRILLGLANVGGIASMSKGFAAQGTYTSPVLDASQISRFGKMRLRGSLPPDSTLTVATRSGNLQEPGETGWSKWSAELPAQEYLQVPSPSARFLQYRLTLGSKDGSITPVVDEMDVAHQVPNLPPRIKSIRIAGGGQADAEGEGPAMPHQLAGPRPAGDPARQIAWEAEDPNNDPLEYTLYFRAGAAAPWILMQDKLKEAQHQWNTRVIADGQYRVRVEASDAKSNPVGQGHLAARVSDPFTVDNTPPAIGDLKVQAEGNKVIITARIVDRTSRVAGAAVAINSKDDWQAVPASDSIFDSPEEGVVCTIDNLAAGPHQIVLRASDDFGNQAYETVQVTIAPAGK